MRDNNRGYTLVEIIVVLAIIGIALSIAQLSLSNIFNNKLNGYTKEFASLIREVRVNQMSYKSDYKIKIEISNNQYYIKELKGDQEVDGKTIKLPSGYELKYEDTTGSISPVGDGMEISFSSGSGSVTNGAGIYYITSTNSKKEGKIKLSSITGRVAIE